MAFRLNVFKDMFPLQLLELEKMECFLSIISIIVKHFVLIEIR